jgi:zeaxanthin glucosyltransferase
MKIGFVGSSVLGHLNPMTTLARALQSRNHDVVFMALPELEPAVRAANLAFVPSCEFPAGSLNKMVYQLSKRQGEDALYFTLLCVGAIADAMFDRLPAMLKAAGVDAVVVDPSHFYVELVPMSLGMPYVHVSSALHFDYSGYTPLCVYDWPHKNTPEALARNRKGVARFRKMLRQTHAGARAYAKRVGLKIDWRNPYATISKLAWLTQTPKELDFKSSHWPSQFHHTGPFNDGTGRIDIDFPWERLTGEPLIYASMGTLQNGVPHVFRAIVTAVAAQKDAQLVLSVGDHLDTEQNGPLPSNTILVKSAPQLELLKRASLCITHAGLNTVLEALAQGVPQLAIPLSSDQPGVAARVADKKTGLLLPPKELTASRLSLLLDEVLTNSTYRDNARYFQKVIAGRNGLSAAADLLERALGLTTKTSKSSASEYSTSPVVTCDHFAQTPDELQSKKAMITGKQ